MAATTPSATPATPAGPLVKKTQEEIEARKLLAEERQRSLEAAALKDQPTKEAIQGKLLPGETAGEQTRGTTGRIGATPAGKELIGMRSGVPIYADASDVYGTSATGQTPEQQRAAYQAKAAPEAAAAMAKPAPQKTYWSPEYAKDYTEAAARAKALARVGGAEEAARRLAESPKGPDLAAFTATTGREKARQEIAVGTASPETVVKYPELKPLQSIAEPGKSFTQKEMDLINARLFIPKATAVPMPKPSFARVRNR